VDIRTSVLVVGGSLNGLTTALLLARRGVSCLVVERHHGTAIQYKFRGISPRSMEIYRAAGLEAEIRACDRIDERAAAVARMANLAATEVSWQGVPWADTSHLGPAAAATCDQDRLEPILRAHAERHGADVRFGTELVAFRQTGDEVIAQVRDRPTAAITTVHARYLIGADGTASGVREALGIGRHGPGVLQHWLNVIFAADLPTAVDGRPLRSVFVTDINGTLVPRDDGRWLMAVQFAPERGERAEDFTADRCRDLIRRGTGRSDLAIDVIDVRPWDAAAAVADRFQDGRVFLVGDSAHVMPPTGGFGGNTGIQDAANLAWKLDAVITGAAGPGLLATYDAERRPVADRTVAQAVTDPLAGDARFDGELGTRARKCDRAVRGRVSRDGKPGGFGAGTSARRTRYRLTHVGFEAREEHVERAPPLALLRQSRFAVGHRRRGAVREQCDDAQNGDRDQHFDQREGTNVLHGRALPM